jgi:nucleoside-diphosphate-sugar epimerase
LFFSSGDVYGHAIDRDAPIGENSYGYLDPTDLRACYGESKRLGETMCIAWNHQYGIPVKIVRPSHTYGPGMALDDGRVFADFVANVVRREDIIVKSAGTARRPFCYLADATLAYFTVLLKGGDRQAYNVANETCDISVAELATILVDLFPERKLNVRFQKGAQQPGYIQSKVGTVTVDTSKIRALGWKPTTGIQEGFHKTIMSYEY